MYSAAVQYTVKEGKLHINSSCQSIQHHQSAKIGTKIQQCME